MIEKFQGIENLVPEAPEEVQGISELEQEGDYLVQEMKDASPLLITWYLKDLININGELRSYEEEYSPKDFLEDINGVQEIIQNIPKVDINQLFEKVDSLREAISLVNSAIAEGKKREAKKFLKTLRSRRDKMRQSKLPRGSEDFLDVLNHEIGDLEHQSGQLLN